ncbi:alpha/beta-hydrolase [Mycena alexandri]|uniref:Alpha/beta-hydrolase n=1 Tax=Mycena alexandri TaxID=1745969 RepID=A0AAD6T5M5_9AGAR|nr:alpha/beta-hydrolase [Mycena alexandri]
MHLTTERRPRRSLLCAALVGIQAFLLVGAVVPSSKAGASSDFSKAKAVDTAKWVSSSQSFFAADAATPLDVALSIGTYRGISTTNGTERWLGIPFAQPPVGQLRFKAPVAIVEDIRGLQNASSFGNACPQPPSAKLGADVGEDCLFLNVWRPTGTKSSSNLPVLVWIHGGAYMTSAASNPQFDPTRILQRSVILKKAIIFVSMNYRLNTFGFLASTSVPREDLNAGLLDQRQALEFVRENIAAFGGDPSKHSVSEVTIWGQSAGGGSVESHFIYPHAGTPLFRAGIADSSTGPFKNSPDASTYDKPGKPFAQLLSETGCAPGVGAVPCLQGVPYQKLLNISNSMMSSTLHSQLWQPSVAAGSMIPERASVRIARDDFLHLPYLSGTNVNEGNTFATSLRGLGMVDSAEDDTFKHFIGRLVIDNSTLTSDLYAQTLEFFPANDSTLGAPFNTGDSLYDRVAAWYTDMMYLAPRRRFVERAAPLQQIFAYYFRESLPGNHPTLGVFHGSELTLFFGPNPAPIEAAFAEQMIDFYVKFVHDLDPGVDWSAYTLDSTRQVMQLMRDNLTMIPDDWDADKTTFLNSAKVLEVFEK